MSTPLKKRVRPSTASGLIQSSRIPHILDDIRPNTAIGAKEPVLGLEPTYITADLRIGHKLLNSKYTGKQVHGGVDDRNLKSEHGRRNTIGPVDFISNDKTLRPFTAPISENSAKIEERITLDHLNKIKQAFDEADADSSGTLDLEEFKNVFRYFLGLKGASEHQMTALFMKIDSSSDGEINWNEFCTYMQLEYAEKEESYFRSKETAFYLPATIVASPHRDTILSITHTSDNNFLCVSQDGYVSFWSSSMQFKRSKQIESGGRKSKWIIDMILMPQYNKFITATGDREIQFHELSTFEGYCQINSLETVPLKLAYCLTGSDECILVYGDSEGCVSILIIKNVGETLRLWKKMPKVEGIASIGIDSVINEENVKYIRWKVHNDWVQEIRYYHSIRSVISCSTDGNHSLVIGQTLGSTHVSNQKEMKKGLQNTSSLKEFGTKRRLPADETVFKIYKGVKTFDFSKTKNVLATGGMDRLIRLWNPYVPTKPVGILRGHVTPIIHLFMVEDDNRLFSVSNDIMVKVWDIHDQTCLLTVRPKSHLIKGELSAIHYNPISRGLAFATDHVALLRLKNKPLAMQMTTTHKEAVTCSCYNTSFNHVVTSSEGSVIKVWDIENGDQVFEYSDVHDQTSVTDMCFDSTQRRLVTCGQDGKIKIWNYNNGHCLSTLHPEDELSEVSCLVYFTINKNRYIVAAGWDRRINIYSDSSQSLHHVKSPYIKWPDDTPILAHQEDILSIAYLDPHFLATSSYDGQILVWNVTSGRIFTKPKSDLLNDVTDAELLSGDLSISKIIFLQTRSEKREAASLVANGPKGFVHFWNLYDSKLPYAKFENKNGHQVSFMVSNADNSQFITTDVKGFVTVWCVEKYCMNGPEKKPPRALRSWRAHIQPITCASLVESKNCMMTSSTDGTVRVWSLEGHFVGTFGQPLKWNIYDCSSFQHPMAPYDVLMDPGSIPNHPVLMKDDEDDMDPNEITSSMQELRVRKMNDVDIKQMLDSHVCSNSSGKRLRHARLRGEMKDETFGEIPLWSDRSAYKSLRCYDLDEVPPPSNDN
ncbi:cilia- and flagella-associated protein 337-like isoform X1 [Clytia hemisphaerica]|uniref:EF-hand domain-containing protein n=1 Tax=Clytia hemisphaerica TaxID=252671 RepID=A0A7M5WM04_9CNID